MIRLRCATRSPRSRRIPRRRQPCRQTRYTTANNHEIVRAVRHAIPVDSLCSLKASSILRGGELLRRLQVLPQSATAEQVMQRSPNVDDADDDEGVAKRA